jgi:hypothetical protein
MKLRWKLSGIAACLILMLGMIAVTAMGKRNGNVVSLSSFDAEANAVLARALRISATNELRYVHASMVGGKDWTLYVLMEVPKTNWNDVLKTASFEMRKGRERDVVFEVPALSWWKIEKKAIDSVIVTSGFTAWVVLNDVSKYRIFVYTDGGSEGFAKDVWDLFKKQQH